MSQTPAATQTPSYFSHIRTEITPLLPAFAERVLEVGCGSGATLAWLKNQKRCGFAVGLEYDPEAAERAKDVVDQVFCGDAEAVELGEQKFDLVLLLDVLEHLVDPWGFLDRLQHQHLAPGATVIASLPNIRNYRVLKALVFKGEFKYQDAGILDRTHLRFFTRSSAVEMMTRGQLKLEKTIDVTVSKRSYRRIDRLTGGIFRDFFVYQYLIATRFGKAS